MTGPLTGIKVVDFSRVLAGPLCARILSDLGAEVIKIEPPRPDLSRFAFPMAPGMSGYYAQQNAGKRNISVDLNVPGAREIVLKLCDEADILVENFRPGTLGFFQLDYTTLAERNPGLIYASISGYGQGGPWKARMAYAPAVHAEVGLTHHSMRHYGESLVDQKSDSLSHADVNSGVQAVVAILAALHSRSVSGVGQAVDVSMAATTLFMNERAHVDLSDLELGAEPAILGATDTPFFIGPGGETFTVAASLVGSGSFPMWAHAMRRPDLERDQRFLTAELRLKNRKVLHELIQNWIYTFPDMATLDAQLDEGKIALGELRSMKEIGETDWAEYWGAVREVSDRYGGTYKLPGDPWRFSRDMLGSLDDPSFRGEDNRTVLAEKGYSPAEIAFLEESGALVSDPSANQPPAPQTA